MKSFKFNSINPIMLSQNNMCCRQWPSVVVIARLPCPKPSR